MIEITSLYGTPGRDRQSGKRDDYVLMHRLFQRLIRLARLYPEWKTWLKVYRRFNQGTFNNAFTDRIGIFVQQ